MNLFGGSTIRLAWRNLWRSGRRTALALGAIALAQTAVLLTHGLLNGRGDWMIDTMTGPMLGHAQVHALGWREEQAADLVIDRLDERLRAVRTTEGVGQAFARIYAPALVAREIDGHAAMVIGVDAAVESQPGGLLEGLIAGARPHEHRVLVGAMLARDAGIEVGDELALLGQGADGSLANDLVTVAGILSTPIELINRSGIVMPIETAQEIFVMPDMAHEITIRSAAGDDLSLASRVASSPELGGLEVLPWRELAPELVGAIQQSGVVGFAALFIVFLAAAAGVANTMLMATFERRRELGMLLALGTSPLRLIRMILAEAVILGLLGVILGSLIGGALVLWQGHTGIALATGAEEGAEISAYGLSFTGSMYPYLRAGDHAAGFVGVTIVSILAALWPALFTARLEPMEAMRS